MISAARERPEAGVERDRRDLHRGVLVNGLGYVVKTAFPLLMGLVIWLYGKEEFGLFTAAQSIVLVALRVCVLGLDKAILWWVPRQTEGAAGCGIARALIFSLTAAGFAAILVTAILAPALAAWKEIPEATWSLRLMAISLVPMSATEILVGAVLGRRKMEAQVIVKEVAQPFTFLLLAVAAFAAGLREMALAGAFLASQGVALLAAILVFRREFGSLPRAAGAASGSRDLVRYALPMWGAEISNAFLLRLDTLVLLALYDVGTVGVYGVVVMIGNAVRTIRRAFDPIVLAIVSRISSRKEMPRLRAAFSHATSLVIATQLPVYAFVLLFVPWILPILGEGYDAASTPVIVICGFWMVNGVLGLNGLIVSGFGRSDLAFLNVLLTIAVEAALLFLLVPPFGIVGASIAVGAAYTVQNAVQAVQARWLSGAWNYEAKVARIMAAGLAAAAALAAIWWIARPAGEFLARAVAFAGFLAVLGISVLWMIRRGDLAADRAQRGCDSR